MAVNLSNLKPARGSRHRKVRVGAASARSSRKTAGKGNKGQKSRKGYSRRPGFEGGQMPLHRRIPKRGFHQSVSHSEYAVVNVEMLNAFAGREVGDSRTADRRGLLRRGRKPRLRFWAMAI